MDIHEWLQIGIDKGYCSAAVCSTHEGLPMTDVENEDWDQGFDPCVYATRLYEQE
jgi:hypothetical protein